MGGLLASIKADLKWADGAEVKRELDAQVLQLLGPKTEQDLSKPEKKKKKVCHDAVDLSSAPQSQCHSILCRKKSRGSLLILWVIPAG